MRVLCHLADKGSLCKSQVLRICKTTTIPEAINEKLLIDENGKYYQKRMREERIKREKHSEHQRENANKRWKKDECDGNAVAMPLENENENENENRIEDVNANFKKREEAFITEVFMFQTKYPEEMLVRFRDYWTEKTQNKKKMRFELQKTFEISRRLALWANREITFDKTEKPLTYQQMVAGAKDDPDFFKKYKAVMPPGKTKALFYLIKE
jgi:hypothetical protein